MPTEQQDVKSLCDSGCAGVVTERNRYYTGKYMAARDFQDEQEYLVSRQRLHNRLLHGWGIICGLEVKHHTSPDCEKRWVIICAGTAIDCCGRELFLPRDMAFELPLPKAHRVEDSPGAQPPGKDEMWRPFLLGIAYQETLIDYVPALYAENACDTQRLQPDRVREGIHLVCIPVDKVAETCWQAPGTQEDIPCRDDCGGSEQGGTCLEPNCPCGDMVPLALVTFDPEHPEHGFHLDHRGRKHIVASRELLTHIVHINWPPGGELTLAQLREREGKLRIRFDRKILHGDGSHDGVNPMTFVVQYGGVQRNIEFLPFPRHMPPMLEENECEAVFTIDRDYLSDSDDEQDNIAGTWVYVTLKCDFIMDCHHRAVDGNFVHGHTPTGNGVPGGTFESWFRVTSDRDVDRDRDERREHGRDRNRDRY